MRHAWYTADIRALLGPDHPLSLLLAEVARRFGGADYWGRDELARTLLTLWMRGDATEFEVREAAGQLGCEEYVVLLAPWFRRESLEVKG